MRGKKNSQIILAFLAWNFKLNCFLVNQKRKPKRREILGVGGVKFVQGTSELKICGVSIWKCLGAVSCTVLMLRLRSGQEILT